MPYHEIVIESPSHTQHKLRPGIIELAFGEPDPALLPTGLIRDAAAESLETYGPGALAYGAPLGPPGLRKQIALRIARCEGHKATPADILITGGNSQALDLALTMLTAAGDVVLVESPTYALALGTLRDHAVEIAAVPIDEDGLDLAALEETLATLRAAGRKPRLLYTIPTFHNPAGLCLSPARRTRLLELARTHDLIIIEDDVYRDIVYEGSPPPSLWTLDPQAPVVRLGSFSKCLAPGLRVGWINARADLLERLSAAGMLQSGGCVSQYAATVVARVMAGEGYQEHLAGLRRAYASRRDALADALREHLPADCHFTSPAGGFFIWLTLPHGLSATRLLPVAERHAVSFAPGARFSGTEGESSLRLAFCLYDEEALSEGGRRLGVAVRVLTEGRSA